MALVLIANQAAAADDVAASTSSGGLSPTAVGVLIVGIVVVLALAAILWWFLRRKPTRRQPSQSAARRRTTGPAPGFDDAPVGLFMTAFSPPSSSYGKPVDAFHSGGGFHIDARANRDGNPRMQAPIHAPYVAYGHRSDSIVPSLRHGHQRMPGGEPLLYNREATTTLRVNDSTRSYLYEPTTPTDPDADAVEATPKIFGSNNTVDFTYADTDRSNLDLVDSTPTALRDLRDLQTNRSDDSDPYGFVVRTNDSAQIFSSLDDDDSARSSRPYTDDSARSSSRVLMLEETSTRSSGRPYTDDTSARTTAYCDDTDTNALNTNELRHIKVEL